MQNYLIDSSSTLREVMKEMTRRGERNLFLSEFGYLKGSISDGDIRRALLKNASLDDEVLKFAKKDVITTSVGAYSGSVESLFSQKISLIPVVDVNGKIIDILSKENFSHIPISEPNLGQEEMALVQDCLHSSWISSQGAYVSEFETLFKNFVGSSDAIAVSNGTLGLVLALHLIGVSANDEVLVPNLTFGATANAVVQVGAKPILVDVDANTMFIDLKDAESKITSQTKAIIPVYLYGKPGPIDSLVRLANTNGLRVIEDAAEALGTYFEGKHVGTFGDVGVFSFFANKTITTGEGGMLVLRDSTLSKKARLMRSHGFSVSNRYWHEQWGSNFRLTNMQAAVGVGQMSKIDNFLSKKREIAKFYYDQLSPLENRFLRFNRNAENLSDSFWLTTIHLENPSQLTSLIDFLDDFRIETRRFFYPLHIQPAFSKYRGELDYPISVKLFESGLCLPSSTKITIPELEYVVRKIKEFFS